MQAIVLAAGLEGCVQQMIGVVFKFEDLTAIRVGEGVDLLEWAAGEAASVIDDLAESDERGEINSSSYAFVLNELAME
ncbi:MAG: hypothetical protein ABR889_07650 [Acidobacteriaceae bacterium]